MTVNVTNNIHVPPEYPRWKAALSYGLTGGLIGFGAAFLAIHYGRGLPPKPNAFWATRAIYNAASRADTHLKAAGTAALAASILPRIGSIKSKVKSAFEWMNEHRYLTGAAVAITLAIPPLFVLGQRVGLIRPNAIDILAKQATAACQNFARITPTSSPQERPSLADRLSAVIQEVRK